MAKPEIPFWAAAEEAGQITDPPDAKKDRGTNAGEPEAAQYRNSLASKVWKWIRGLQGDYADIVVGSPTQVTDRIATHDVDDFVAAIVNGDKVLFLDGTHALGQNEDITEDDVTLVFDRAAILDDGTNRTFTMSGARARVYPGRWTGFTAGDIIISGVGSLFEAIDLDISFVTVDDGSTVILTGNSGGMIIPGAGLTQAERTVPTTKALLGAVPTGTMIHFGGVEGDLPAAWLLCYGQAVNNNDEPDLFAVIVKRQAATDTPLPAGFAFTTDFATDNKLDDVSHGLVTDDLIHLSNSGGALPTGLNAQTRYFVINETANDFEVSLTQGGAAVSISSDGSGTHSYHTVMTIPDKRGRVMGGLDNMNNPGGAGVGRITDAEADSPGGAQGGEDQALSIAQLASHSHNAGNAFSVSAAGTDTRTTPTGTIATSTTGSNAAHPNVQPSTWENVIIKA